MSLLITQKYCNIHIVTIRKTKHVNVIRTLRFINTMAIKFKRLTLIILSTRIFLLHYALAILQYMHGDYLSIDQLLCYSSSLI